MVLVNTVVLEVGVNTVVLEVGVNGCHPGIFIIRNHCTYVLSSGKLLIST